MPGSYIAERLAGVLDGWQRLADAVWLRVDDFGPAELEQALGAACNHRWSAGETPRRPGLPPQQRLLELLERAPEGAVIVLELGGRVNARVTQLVSGIRSAVADRGVRVVVVAESWFNPPVLHGPDCVLPATDLFDRDVLDECCSDRNQARLLRYAGRRVAVLDDVLAAGRLWSADAVAEALDASHGLSSLLSRLTTVLLDQLTPDQRSALQVAASTGYWHPRMGTRPLAPTQLRPWVVPMEQQWGWLRPIWLPTVRRQLARLARQHRSDGHRATWTAPAGDLVLPVPPTTRTATGQSLLEARLFGSLAVRVDGAPVESWHGQKGMSVLRYLLSRRRHACARDELLEEFWPDVPAAAARNRLQVAVSGLRRAFLDVTPLNVVEYSDGGYRINPKLRVEVDVETFEHGLRAAGAAEHANDKDGARAAYRQAIALYRGDFAADAPREEWTLLPRESLRIRLVDALDRLSHIDLADGRIEDCIATAHHMIDIDPCREDAHRLLMRCYATQGRTYQALRQYEFCRRVLRTTLHASPAPETTKLYLAIRNSSGSDWKPAEVD